MLNKGGRGKKAGYKTLIVRVPEPIYDEVRALINDFHAKPVTGNVIEEKIKPVTDINLEDDISVLPLSRGIFQNLKRAQINTVQELVMARDKMHGIKGISTRSTSKINATIANLIKAHPQWRELLPVTGIVRARGKTGTGADNSPMVR